MRIPILLAAATALLFSACGSDGNVTTDASDILVDGNVTPDMTEDVATPDTMTDTRDTGGDHQEDQDSIGDAGPDATGDTSTDDPGTNDATTDTVPDSEPDADDPADSLNDSTGDAFPDVILDIPPTDINGCPSLDFCGIECEKGFKLGSDGCPVCRCAECDTASDCNMLDGFFCLSPVCSATGDCVCDCRGFQDLKYPCPDGTVLPLASCTAAGITTMWAIEQECPTLCHDGDTAEVSCPDETSAEWCTCSASQCRPYCDAIGSYSEGWYDGCTGELIEYAMCAGHTAVCSMMGSKSEGWYDDAGSLIGWAQCAPEWTCRPLVDVCQSLSCTIEDNPPQDWECADGTTKPLCACSVETCTPTCGGTGAKMVWQNGCTNEVISDAECDGCNPYCDKIGTRSEGWYSDCDDGLIAYDMCGTGTWSCTTPPSGVCEGAWPGCLTAGQTAGQDDFRQCCPGLVRLRPVKDNAGTCVDDPAGSTCSACGNAVCGEGENRCNCPEDCTGGDFPGSSGSSCLRPLECPPDFDCLWADGADSGTCAVEQ